MEDRQLQCGRCGKLYTGTAEDIHTSCPMCPDGKLHDVTGFVDEQPEGRVNGS